MKRVAIIAPDFTPSSLPPAMRVRYFASHLPEFGWEPIVITTNPYHYEYLTDPENERLLPPELRVIRTGALSARLTHRIGIADIGMRSLWHHWRALSKLCRTEKVDALLLPVPPFVPMVLGRLAFMRFRLPYVIDYIDPWRTDYYQKMPKSQRPSKWWLADGMANVLEPISVRRVAHIIGVSKGTTDMVASHYSFLRPEYATEIPYGGEKADFDYVRQHRQPNPIFDPDDNCIHLSAIGHFNYGLRGAAEALFDALRLGLEREHDLFARVKLHFVGTTYASGADLQYQVMPLATEKGIATRVTEHPQRISYLQSLQVMQDSQTLFILSSDRPHYTASKIFPYILAQRPILAIFQEKSSVITILQETKAGDPISFSAESPIAGKVEVVYEHLRELLLLSRDYTPQTHWDMFEQYTARAMTQRLAAVLDRIASR